MTKPASGASLNTGHALYTSLQACWAMLEGSGTTSADSTGNGHTLTFAGGGTPPTWSTNGAGEAIIAIGTALAQPLAVGTPFTLLGTSSWSIAWRVKETNADNQGLFLGDKDDDNNFLFYIGGTLFRFRASSATNYDWSGTTDFVTDHNYLLVYDQPGGKLHFYVNGTQDGTGLTVTANDAALSIDTLGAGHGDNTLRLIGNLTYVYVWQGRALTGTDAGTLNSTPYVIFSAAGSFTATPTDVPKNHGNNITLTLAGTSTTWAGGGSEFSISGVTGATKISENVTSTTAATLVITTDATHTGTLTITDGDALTATITISTATLAFTPTSGATGTTPTLTLTGAHTVWTQETAAGLFSVSGGTGASIGTPTITTNTAGTVVLTVGSAAGTLTVTDNSTGATTTFTATAGTITITNPVANQWKRGGGSSATFTVAGTTTGSVATVEVSKDGGSTWTTLDAAPSAGAYTGTVSLAASESDYTIQVRFSNATSVTASVAGIANVRTVLAFGGQSNEAGRGSNNQTVLSVYGSGTHRKKTAAGYAVLADPSGTDGSAAGSYAVHEVNILSAALGHRIGVCNFAVGGTTIAQWQKGGGGAGYYELLAAAVTAVGGCDIVRMGPCESDAIAGTSTSTYHAGLASLVASWQADFPATKIVWRTLQELDTGTATQPHQDAINVAILAAAGTTHGQATGDVTGVYLMEVRSVPAAPGDIYHWLTDQQLADVGGLGATADYAALNPAGAATRPLRSSRIGRGAQ